MPKTREQIKHEPVSTETWRPQRTQVGGLWFDPLKIQPLGDHILVELEAEPERGTIVKPDIARNQEIGTRRGHVVRVGPGKFDEKKFRRKIMTLRPGDRVIIGHYSDWESWFSDYEGRGRNVVLCQEADVRVVIE